MAAPIPPHRAVGDTVADLARLHAMHEFLCGRAAAHPAMPPGDVDPWILTLTIPGDPATKARHRTTEDGQTYKDRADREAEKRTRAHLTAMVAARGGTLPGNLALGCIFYRRTRGTIDADNMLKHVCDAGNRVAWLDDNQITAVLGVIEYDPAAPRTCIVIGPHHSTMHRNPLPRPATVRRPRVTRATRLRAGLRTGSCKGCGKPIAHTLTHCGDCRDGLRRAARRTADLGGLFPPE